MTIRITDAGEEQFLSGLITKPIEARLYTQTAVFGSSKMSDYTEVKATRYRAQRLAKWERPQTGVASHPEVTFKFESDVTIKGYFLTSDNTVVASEAFDDAIRLQGRDRFSLLVTLAVQGRD